MLALAAFLTVPARGEEPPEMIRASRIQDFVGIAFRPGSTNWVQLEASSDLRYWTPVVQVAAQVAAVLYVDVEAANQSHRFFRTRAPGISLDVARALWNDAGITNYVFRFERISQLPPYLYSALVTVRQGVKQISEAVADGVSVAAPDPSLFPAVSELFDELAQAKRDGIRQVWVTFDPVSAFPARCTLDRRGGVNQESTALVQYRVAGFRPLEPLE